MKWLILYPLVLLISAVSADLALAEPCDEELCKLPDCRCSSTNIPGGLNARDTPQFVTITFDDGVNVINIETYRNMLNGRRNKNGCPAAATFYINHEYTNYQLVNELYNNGHEIALHSITHQTPQTYWAEASYEDMVKEFGEQKIQMAHFANIPYEALKGIRIPFLQLPGNASFEVIKSYDLVYDSSWPTTTILSPGLWPYTLDYASTQDCPIPPCPTASIPGVWVSPLIAWLDLMNIPCSMVDACFAFPDRDDEDAWYRFILTNFERHYLGNRAPFGFYVHEWYVSSYPAVGRALVKFMNLVNNLEDAYMVTTNEVIDWVKDPVPIDEYRERPCKTFIPTPCPAASCGPLRSEHNGLDYWIQICNVCPNTYPWLGNPLGQ